MILSAVINFIMPTAGCEATSCFTMEHIQVFQTSDFQQAFRKVITCNGRYQQGNNKPRCSVATHVYIRLETELERIGEIALFSDIYMKIKVLQLIWVCYNLRPLLVRYESPKEHHTLLLKLSHVSRLRNPKYFTPTV